MVINTLHKSTIRKVIYPVLFILTFNNVLAIGIYIIILYLYWYKIFAIIINRISSIDTVINFIMYKIN